MRKLELGISIKEIHTPTQEQTEQKRKKAKDTQYRTNFYINKHSMPGGRFHFYRKEVLNIVERFVDRQMPISSTSCIG